MNAQFTTAPYPNANSRHECSWGIGAQSTRPTCPVCALPTLAANEKATLDIVLKVLAEIMAPDPHRRMLAKLALASWTPTAKSRGINILGVSEGVVTYHLGVPRLQAFSRIETFWPDMPAAFQTEVIMEAVDKAMGTGVVERYKIQERKREERIHCLEERNRALEEEVAQLRTAITVLREPEVAVASVRLLR